MMAHRLFLDQMIKVPGSLTGSRDWSVIGGYDSVTNLYQVTGNWFPHLAILTSPFSTKLRLAYLQDSASA